MTINFEKDQQDAMKKTDNIQSLADQVERLQTLQREVDFAEEKLKNVPINVGVGDSFLEIDKNLDISFVRFLEVELPKMQINLVVEL